MKLLFFGDMAIPDIETYSKLDRFLNDKKLFKDKVVVGNLEGLIVDKEKALEKYTSQLFNITETLNLFKDNKYTVLTLANNHIKDIPNEFDNTIKSLKEKNIGYAGAGKNEDDSCKPHEFEINNKKYAVFSHCWNVMSKIMEKKSKEIFVNDKLYNELIEDVRNYKINNKETIIIVCLHWNFDFEMLPFPNHRKIAMKLIDAGVKYVIGGHSHVINGGEIYKDGIIIYGMGNFCIPSNKFFEGKLKYLNEATKQVILEVDEESNEISYYYIENSNITKENFKDGNIIKKYSKYRGMDEKEYLKYFRKNRTKKMLVPVYSKEKNTVKDMLTISRMKLLRRLKNIK